MKKTNTGFSTSFLVFFFFLFILFLLIRLFWLFCDSSFSIFVTISEGREKRTIILSISILVFFFLFIIQLLIGLFNCYATRLHYCNSFRMVMKTNYYFPLLFLCSSFPSSTLFVFLVVLRLNRIIVTASEWAR